MGLSYLIGDSAGLSAELPVPPFPVGVYEPFPPFPVGEVIGLSRMVGDITGLQSGAWVGRMSKMIAEVGGAVGALLGVAEGPVLKEGASLGATLPDGLLERVTST